MVKVLLLSLAAVAAVLIQTEAKDPLNTNIRMMDGIAEDQTQGRFLNLVIENIIEADQTGKSSPKVILDIGCGSGEVMEHLIKRVEPLITHDMIFHGIDHSPMVIKMAKEQMGKETSNDHIKRLFYIGDMHNLTNVEDHSVDFMYSLLTFQHSADINDLFKHLGSKLKTGSKLTFSTISMDIKDKSHNYPSGRLSNKWMPVELPDVVNSNYANTLTQWTTALEKAGFAWNVIRMVENNNIIGEDYIYKKDIVVRDIIIDAIYVM